MKTRRSSRWQTARTAAHQPQRGIALITVLLLLTLLSGIAVALVYKVNHEQHLQRADSGNTVAYYGAEAGMEKMMADLSLLYTQKAAPTNCDIVALQASPPNAAAVGTTYREYVYNVPPPAGGGCAAPTTNVQTISSGANAGLQAEIVRMNLQVTADSPAGDEARLIRNVEVAEIPVFQFGVFSQSDLSYFPGPSFDFAGRVQTNGNLFLAEGGGATLTFHSPIRAAGDVVRDQLANGANTLAQGRTGQVLIPTAPNGCDGGQPACRNLQVNPNEGSSIGGPTPTYSPTGTGSVNPAWNTISMTTYAGNILSGTTGAKPLTLSFVQPGVGPIEIIRRPLPAESPSSLVGESRLYNQAQIRVLLSDDPNELPGGAGDPQNIRLANLQTNGGAPDYTNGVPVVGVGNSFFAEGVRTTDTTAGVTTVRVGPGGETNWTIIPSTPPGGQATLVPATAPVLPPSTTTVGATTTTVQPWNLIDGYLRVEIRNGGGAYAPVTAEWLQLGFARGPNAPVNGALNTVHPDAILILQQQADRNGDGSASAAELATDSGTGSVVTGPATRNNWYPINMYESREGEFRENQRVTANCAIGGVLNLVEIDVRNLQRWLAGTIGVSGVNTEYVSQNGYVLFVSDRRGMVASPTAGTKNGEYGYEDVINPGSAAGTPDATLNAGEDVNGNNLLDTYSVNSMGLGFGVVQPGTLPNAAVNCMAVARPNWVSGPRHGVRLVNGSLGNLPLRPDNGQGGFTLASEQPAYVLGNYNANAGGFGNPHAAAAVMGDTVTLLSNSWTDLSSFKSPASVNGRPAVTSYYRLAIASGKNINFPQPTFAGVPQDFGTDGGVHNFLRYLENWGGQTLNYEGSMVSLFYSQYATGVFKCCGTVYSPPTRAYAFDTDFLDLSKLPPGTPKFRDVVNVGFQQVY
jgi:Tfp pilus assembly protein PilX